MLAKPGDKWDAFLAMIAPFKKNGPDAKSRIIVFCNTKKVNPTRIQPQVVHILHVYITRCCNTRMPQLLSIHLHP